MAPMAVVLFEARFPSSVAGGVGGTLLLVALILFGGMARLGATLVPWERREGTRRIQRHLAVLAPSRELVIDGESTGPFRPQDVLLASSDVWMTRQRNLPVRITTHAVLVRRGKTLFHVAESEGRPEDARALAERLAQAASLEGRSRGDERAPTYTTRDLRTGRWQAESKLTLGFATFALVALILGVVAPAGSLPFGWRLSSFVLAALLRASVAPLLLASCVAVKPKSFAKAYGEGVVPLRPTPWLPARKRLLWVAFALLHLAALGLVALGIARLMHHR